MNQWQFLEENDQGIELQHYLVGSRRGWVNMATSNAWITVYRSYMSLSEAKQVFFSHIKKYSKE